MRLLKPKKVSLVGVGLLLGLLLVLPAAGDSQSVSVQAVSYSDAVRFVAQGAKVTQMRLELFNLAGQRLYDTDFVSEAVLDWHLVTEAGDKVADGVYLYVVSLKDDKGMLLGRKLGKVVVSKGRGSVAPPLGEPLVSLPGVSQLGVARAVPLGGPDFGSATISGGHVSVTPSFPAAGIWGVGDGQSPQLVFGDSFTTYVTLQWYSPADFGLLQTYIGGAADGNLALQPISGNVGIGTTTPPAPLTVQEALVPVQVLRVEDSAGSLILRADFDHTVGINTAPSAALEVVESPSFPDPNGEIKITELGTTTSDRAQIDLIDPTRTWSIGHNAGTDIFFFWNQTLDADAIWILPDNRVAVFTLGSATTTHLCWNPANGVLSSCASAAEMVPTVDIGHGYPQEGDLVSLLPAVANPYGDDHAPFVVTKAASPYDPNLIGFLVDPKKGADGKKLNDYYMPLAIYGYFPVKVTMENGPIRRGDAITSSSKPGYGMKATKPGRIVGYALESADEEGIIQVFAQPGYYMGDAPARIENLEAEVSALKQERERLLEEMNTLQGRLEQLENQVRSLQELLKAAQSILRRSINKGGDSDAQESVDIRVNCGFTSNS